MAEKFPLQQFIMGLLSGLNTGVKREPVVPEEPEETDAYTLASGTLTVKDETGLSFGFDWDTMQMDVGVTE